MNMLRMVSLVSAGALILGLSVEAYPGEMAGKGIKGLSNVQLVNLAQSAAPLGISREATVLIPGEDGKLVEARKGTNGFTCVPDISGQEEPDPFCGDRAATQWLMDVLANNEKPGNTVPGIAYMGKGGWHWEKDGKIVSSGTEGAMRVKEPPHWMVFWPVGSRETALPTMPGKFGAYIMYDGSPYAHIMIYQDPNKIGR